MSEVGAADRSRLLRSKRAELSGIVTSRKRKLREFFAVCDNESPIPQLSTSNPDAPPTNAAEAHFLEVTDILQDRLFDEANLPTRQPLRTDGSKQRPSIRRTSPEARTRDPSRNVGKIKRDGSKVRKIRANTPGAWSDGDRAAAMDEKITERTSSSKSSQTDFAADSANILSDVVEEATVKAKPWQPIKDFTQVSEIADSSRTRKMPLTDENSPNGTARRATRVAPVDPVQSSDPDAQESGSYGTPRKATRTQLQDEQIEQKYIHDTEKGREPRHEHDGHLSINLPAREGGRTGENVSSPSSTVDAHSATTPALHDASTDTSPDNDSRYDADRIRNREDEPSTPAELRQSMEKITETTDHSSTLRAQIEAARSEVMRSSPTSAETQLLEEQATTASIDLRAIEDSRRDRLSSFEGHRITKIIEAARSSVDADEKIVRAHSSRDETNPLASVPITVISGTASEMSREIMDSETEEQILVSNTMEVDVATSRPSWRNNASTKPPAAISAAQTQTHETPVKPVVNIKKLTISSTTSSVTATPVLERRNTRIGSGVLERKSISDIIEEKAERLDILESQSVVSPASPMKSDSDHNKTSKSASRSGTPQPPAIRVRTLFEKQRQKERERSKLSNVIFANISVKPSSETQTPENSIKKSADLLKEHYFTPLFLATSTEKRSIPSLESLLATAHKTITTSNAYVPIQENQTARILNKIHTLQFSNKWSLRQPKRSCEPIRPTTHWDVLLQEAKWMRTDFREERKWKMAVARNMAHACADWVASSSDERMLLQVKATPPKRAWAEDMDMGEPSTHPTPDLIASRGFDSPMEDFDDEPHLNLLESIPPTAIFGLQDDDVVFGLRRSPIADKLLEELPMYGAPLQVPKSDLPTSEIDPDRFWKRPALPLSKYVEGRMELKMDPPPRKRSRFDYDDDEDDDGLVVFGEARSNQPLLPPESTDVALFDPEHRHIRERLQNAHQFRPPSEFQMPLQSFFECRLPSQWTWDEDKELKVLVREYTYNWSLISSILSSKSRSDLATGPERRTPWECFERWIELEGLPGDMQKTHYFRLYTSRIENANRVLLAQSQNSAQGQTQQQNRKRTSASIRVDRRRNQKHLMLIETMRKLQKKRETTVQKQQHAAGMAAMRKANEAPHVAIRNLPATTPQDFSRIKYEREEAIKERLLHLQQRQEAQRRAAMGQRNTVANPQQPGGVPNGIRQPAGVPIAVNQGSASASQNLAVHGQNRPRPVPPPMPGHQIPNNLRVPSMELNSVPQVPMQGQMPLPNPSLDVGLVSRAHAISQHQQAILRQQQSQIPGQPPPIHNSPPRMNNLSASGFPIQGNMMPPFQSNPNIVSTPPINSLSSPASQVVSPRLAQQSQSHTHVQRMEIQFKASYPTATPASMITQALTKQAQRQNMNQNVMNAAAGAGGGSPMPVMNSMGAAHGTPQLYAQMLRQQQDNQQKAQQAQQQAQQQEGGSHQAQQANGGTGNSGQGHAHRASSASLPSGK